MKTKYMKAVALVLAMVCIFCFPVAASATSQGTDGTEMEVMQPEKLEIQLGEEWAGVEFELKTDAGMYPDAIPVGSDGVLRLEIGGSTQYILSCMNSSVEVPVPGEANSPEENESDTETAEDPSDTGANGATEEVSDTDIKETAPAENSEEKTIAGIPVANLAMFGGGLLVAIVALIGISIHNKRKESADVDESDEF